MRRVVDGLGEFTGRGGCTDAERRAALWLHAELRARGHEAWVETHWVRPQRSAALALACLAAVGGSLLSTVAAEAGLAVAALGLVALAYDAPRRGLVLNDRWRARLRRVPYGALAACGAAVTAAAAARLGGTDAAWLGAAQLLPTLVLLAALAAAIDVALSEHSPGANDNASGVAVAIALSEALGERAAVLLVGAGHAVPRAHQPDDLPEHVGDDAMEAALAFALENAERREVFDRL